MEFSMFWLVCVTTIAVGQTVTGNGEQVTSNPPPTTTVSEETTVFIITPTTTERIPDDYLNWFFHHSFKKLDEYFQREDEREPRMGTKEETDEEETAVKNWKLRVSKVILKLILTILAIVGMILFIIGVFFFMFISFLLFKFLGHLFQCFREQKKYKNSTTAYQVNI